jgi:toxin-antitoxin system PIN domain toxin
MRHLCDVNVFLAAAVEDHPHHQAARNWLNGLSSDDTAEFCRITQAAFLRLLTNEAVLKENAVSNREAAIIYAKLLQDGRVRFQSEPENLERLWLEQASIDTKSPLIWIDAYLASFARLLGMRLVTFDRGFSRYEGLDLLLLRTSSQATT